MFQRAALFGDQQNAAGFAVEPVHQFQKGQLWARHAQLFDDAETHPRAAVHGHAGGLVQHQQMLVFVNHSEIAYWCRRRAHGLRLVLGPCRDAYRRQAQHVAGGQARFGAGAAFVYAYFPAADDAVDVGFGDALEVAQQEIVQTLAGRFRVHLHALYLSQRSLGIALYNGFH